MPTAQPVARLPDDINAKTCIPGLRIPPLDRLRNKLSGYLSTFSSSNGQDDYGFYSRPDPPRPKHASSGKKQDSIDADIDDMIAAASGVVRRKNSLENNHNSLSSRHSSAMSQTTKKASGSGYERALSTGTATGGRVKPEVTPGNSAGNPRFKKRKFKPVLSPVLAGSPSSNKGKKKSSRVKVKRMPAPFEEEKPGGLPETGTEEAALDVAEIKAMEGAMTTKNPLFDGADEQDDDDDIPKPSSTPMEVKATPSSLDSLSKTRGRQEMDDNQSEERREITAEDVMDLEGAKVTKNPLFDDSLPAPVKVKPVEIKAVTRPNDNNEANSGNVQGKRKPSYLPKVNWKANRSRVKRFNPFGPSSSAKSEGNKKGAVAAKETERKSQKYNPFEPIDSAGRIVSL